MSKKDEALKLALEALEGCEDVTADVLKAITAIREALAAVPEAHKQPAQVDPCIDGSCSCCWANLDEQPAPVAEPHKQQEPVATASAWFALVMNAAAELEDASNCLRDEDAKRVAISGAKHYRDAAKALYTSPQPSKPWVGLTDEERDDIWERHHTTLGGWDYGGDDVMYGRHFEPAVVDIEAKLKEKNT